MDELKDAIKACKDWSEETEEALRHAVPMYSGALFSSIIGRVKVRNGEPYAISYSFLRYGAWIEKGAGNGAGATVGSTWKDRHGNRKTTRRASLGKAGTLRPHQAWFEHVIENRMRMLPDLLARHIQDAIVREIKLR